VRSTTRSGQDKLAEVQNILHETITGNRIVQGFWMESWEAGRYRKAAQRFFRANLRSVQPPRQLSADGHHRRGGNRASLLLGRDQINKGVFTPGTFLAFIIAVFKLYDPVRKFALFNNSFQQALGASSEIFRFMDIQDEVREKSGAKRLPKFARAIRFEMFLLPTKAGRVRETSCTGSISKCKPARCWRCRIERGREEHVGAFDPRFFDVSGGHNSD